MRFSAVSPLRLAVSLALVGTIAAAAPASAFTPSLRTVSVDDGRTDATVVGSLRTGAWRLVVTRAGVAARLVVYLERGDVRWRGRVVAQERQEGRWVVTERAALDAAGHLGRSVCAPKLDACVPAGSVRPAIPGGAQRLAATFLLDGGGSWTIAGGVRQASEPFVLGRWIDTPVDDVRF
jgi:hypothetical protein